MSCAVDHLKSYLPNSRRGDKWMFFIIFQIYFFYCALICETSELKDDVISFSHECSC